MTRVHGILVLAAAIGFAAPAYAQEAPSSAVVAPGSDFEPIKTKSGTIQAPPEGKAQIVFWRPGTIVGMALGCTVREGTDDNEIARLGAGKYYLHVAEPGKHTYYTTGEATDRLN